MFPGSPKPWKEGIKVGILEGWEEFPSIVNTRF
jgi:hypothetical protein